MARWVECRQGPSDLDKVFVNFDRVKMIRPKESGAQLIFGHDDFMTVRNSVAELLDGEDVRYA